MPPLSIFRRPCELQTFTVWSNMIRSIIKSQARFPGRQEKFLWRQIKKFSIKITSWAKYFAGAERNDERENGLDCDSSSVGLISPLPLNQTSLPSPYFPLARPRTHQKYCLLWKVVMLSSKPVHSLVLSETIRSMTTFWRSTNDAGVVVPQ